MSDAPIFTTLGCRLNAYETEAMKELAQTAGVENVYVINTCAVTAEAVRKSKQEIRKQKRQFPEKQIIVTGCAAQIDPDSFAEMAEVNAVIGNTEKLSVDTWRGLSNGFIGQTERVQVDDIMSVTETAEHLIDGFGTRSRAYVQVQNGCDHRCTFCIIPFGRGNSRSVPAGVVVDQIKRLVDSGYNEVVLTGVDLTSWGADLPATPKLGDLVMRILKLVPDLNRLRISSIDSIEVDENLMQAIATEPRLMPHLHLSLQHGDDLILKRMKRRHGQHCHGHYLWSRTASADGFFMNSPILYSFRRCPYAIRARLALASSQVEVELREILLRDKAAAFLKASPSQTVPTLVLSDTVIDESYDIMHWALTQYDPEHWLDEPDTGRELVTYADGPFKQALDRTKYASRYPDQSMSDNRDKASAFLYRLDKQLAQNGYLFGSKTRLSDMAILPFVRQFAFIDKA